MSALPFSSRSFPTPIGIRTELGGTCDDSTGSGGDDCIYVNFLPLPMPGGVSPAYTPSSADKDAQPPCYTPPE